jgi:hypothetical protein
MDESDRQELALRELAAIFSNIILSLSTFRECFERHNFDSDEIFYELCQPATDWAIVDRKVPSTKSAAQPPPTGSHRPTRDLGRRRGRRSHLANRS